jgi:prepilin-type N-terminal cleavage/methylation domain-containing protein
MMNMFYRLELNKKAGFTLVELSIVLVIIGLIVGGIVGGQSLVRSAQINSVVSDFKKWQVAVTAFEMQYDGLPGDITDAAAYWPSGATNGNGDNLFSTAEIFQTWKQLALSEIIPGAYSGVAGTSPDVTVTGVNTPATKMDGGGYLLRESAAALLLNKPFLSVGKPRPLQPQVSGSLFTGAEAKKIDKKMDDGVANTGRLMGFGHYDTDTCTGVSYAHAIGQDYILSSSDLTCQLRLLLRE